LYLAPRHGAMGMALARVIGEATLSMMLMCLAARAGLLGALFPHAQRHAAQPSRSVRKAVELP
jgi:hypothetical protein